MSKGRKANSQGKSQSVNVSKYQGNDFDLFTPSEAELLSGLNSARIATPELRPFNVGDCPGFMDGAQRSHRIGAVPGVTPECLNDKALPVYFNRESRDEINKSVPFIAFKW